MATATADKKADSGNGLVCVLDMGKHSKKRIRRLRRGGGQLMTKVENAIADLQDQGHLDANAQTVVVVVREEPKLTELFD